MTFDNVSLTVTVYDVLDRAMKVTLADGSEIGTEYTTDEGGSYITNSDGEVAQHIEYVPFGEVFIEELEPWRKSAAEGKVNLLSRKSAAEGKANLLSRKSAAEGKANSNNTWNTPYLFNFCVNERQIKPSYICPSAANSRYTNAKAFDEETGMYYYGARYYEPRLSLWMSVDPFAEDYSALSAYSYCANNPINGIDVKGEKILLVNGYWKSGVLGRLIGSDAPKQQYWGAKFAQEAQ
ncbi:MAG: RHS repeat-associated core domain-containing protein [Prevotella sp.]|nr:RHS repeat-associated core domain-containing protein [Prevotella sp.]